MNRKVIIIYDENSRDISLSNFNETKIHFFDVNTEDDFYNFTIKYFSDKYDLIVIPCSLGDIHTNYAGIKLGICIRLIQDSNKNKYTPIIFISSDSFEEIYSITLEASILSAAGSYLSLPNKYKIESISMKAGVINSQVFKTNVLKRIFLTKPPQVGSHSIANEWGVYRLAKIGCYHLPKPKSNLYLEYLKNINEYSENEFDVNEVKSHKIKFKETLKKIKYINILYVDDEKDKGWELVLKEVFKDAIKSNGNFVAVDTEDKGENEIRCSKWDLILLDLRLTTPEEILLANSSINKFAGGRLLKLAKELNPSVPVIMITASNKIWNLENVIEIGADGYYIKESPEYSQDLRYSIDNYINFLNNISIILDKSRYLKWFWIHSKEIKEYIKLNYKSHEILANRICEKLDIAFGLLKLKQNTFDKKYLFTDYELAFLTLWSILNEFSYAHIREEKNNEKKTVTLRCTLSNKEIAKLKVDDLGKSSYISCIGNLKVSPSEKYKKRFKFDLNINSSAYVVDRYSLFEKYDYTVKNINDLSFQIPSFLLIENKGNLLDDFMILNRIRNKLDYTHPQKNFAKTHTIYSSRNEELAKSDFILMFRFLFSLITDKQIPSPE